MSKAAFSICVILAASPAMAQVSRCMVSDPTGTPLNFRNAPNGDILGTLPNGVFIRVIGQVRDNRGRRWAQVETEGSRESVWVFREFVSCR
jgi:hypothetical protein